MKKTFILSITSLFLGIASVYAQPVISSITGAPLGTKTMGYLIPGPIVAATAGAAQTWDYSAIPHDTSSYYFKSIAYASLPQAMKDSFPTGNEANEVYMSGALVATQVFELNASAFIYLGLNTTVFPIQDTQLVFPFSYLETHAGFTYDAYGTLKTPFGTYNNAVRLREVSNGNFKYDFWLFDPSGYKLLMEYKVDTVTQVVSGQTFYNTDAVTAVNDYSMADDAFVLFPNPAKDQLHFKSLWTGIANIDISDVLGHVLYKSQVNLQKDNQVTIDIAGFPQGVYIVKINEGGKIHTRNVMIK